MVKIVKLHNNLALTFFNHLPCIVCYFSFTRTRDLTIINGFAKTNCGITCFFFLCLISIQFLPLRFNILSSVRTFRLLVYVRRLLSCCLTEIGWSTEIIRVLASLPVVKKINYILTVPICINRIQNFVLHILF